MCNCKKKIEEANINKKLKKVLQDINKILEKYKSEEIIDVKTGISNYKKCLMLKGQIKVMLPRVTKFINSDEKFEDFYPDEIALNNIFNFVINLFQISNEVALIEINGEANNYDEKIIKVYKEYK